MKPLRLLLLLSVLAGCTAWATPTYPGIIATEMGVDFVPQQCSLCHANGKTEKGTVTTPFGLSMRSRGLVLENPASLRAALARLETDLVDSDGDGRTDIAELKAKDDPNVGKDALKPPRYGCGASVVPGAMAALGMLALMRVWRRRYPGT